VAEQFARRWQALSGQPYELLFHERAFSLSSMRPMTPPPGALVRATAADRDLLVRWTLDFGEEALGDSDLAEAERTVDARLGDGDPQARGLYLWVDGAPVSMAGYTGPTPHGIRVGPVYTPPELRGRGYAQRARRADEPGAAGWRALVLLSLHQPRQSHCEPHL
jgi:hypothetical protein